MAESPRLITDATGTHKLKVSLPGGRYQLSLDDRAVILPMDELGYDLRDVVPDGVVPVLTAMGDAWFPNQRDVDSVISDLSLGTPLSATESSALRAYVTDNYVREWQVERVLAATDLVGLSDVSRDDLQISSVDVDVQSLFRDDDEPEPTPVVDEDGAAEDEPTADADAEADSSEPQPPDFESIPGIGPERATSLCDAGVGSLEALATTRPADLASVDGISEGIAIVAIEGARERIGRVRPPAERLAAETGVDEAEFDAALSSLAAAGVPASEASPTLRVAFGPTVADVDAVTGAQAYFLWEAGYRTPIDLVDATVEELVAVDQIGGKTAPEIKAAAADLVGVE